jgi:polysaccharide biosynthesis protein PslE
MNATLTYARGSMLRELANTVAYHRWRILLVGVAGMLLTVGAAVVVRPGYEARSSLLVLLGTEYTYRGVAGQQAPSNGGLTQAQILHTEADILGSEELRRAVIGQIGLATLYPQMLRPPSGVSGALAEAKTYIRGLFQASSGQAGTAKLDPLVGASQRFSNDLRIMVDKEASVIDLTFTHPDAELAAAVLRQLEADYQDRRRMLYGDVQVPVLQTQVNRLHRQLTAADDALSAFKLKHNISDFEARRSILLQQQGTLETALRAAESGIAQQASRVSALDQQLRVATNAGSKNGAAVDPAAALEAMVEAYRSRQSHFTSHYFGSGPVDRAGSDALMRQTEIAQLRSRRAFAVLEEKDKAEASLGAEKTARDSVTVQLATVTRALRAIDDEELKLRELQRALAVADDSYRAAAKVLHERSIVEQLDAGQIAGVRIIQPALVPGLPRPLRRLILDAGTLLTALLMTAVALLSHFFRTTYFTADALEFDTDLAVLATVPDSRDLPRLGLLGGSG